MDEVDGMGGNEDRGGVQELIRLIKASAVPIICICNDRQHTKIRSLANHCFDLRLRRPQKGTIARRAMDVARREGLALDGNAADLLVESVGNDIRQVLNCLQMWRRNSSTVSYMDMKSRIWQVEKDSILRMTAFDGVRSILDPKDQTLFQRQDSFFLDYSLVPLLVQQNYVDSIQSCHEMGDKSTRMSAASEALSDCDLIDSMLRRDQNWSLLPFQAVMTVRVGTHTRGGLGFPKFPEWLGKNSTGNKRRRLLGDLAMHLSSAVSGGQEAVRLNYAPVLRRRLVSPLLQKGAEGVQETIAMLDEYGMSREDLFETLPELQLPGYGEDLDKIDSKTKSAFTRKYNQGVHRSQAIAGAAQAGTGKKRKVSTAPEDLVDGDEAGEEEPEEDNDVSQFVAKKKGKGAAKSKKAGGEAKPRTKKKKA
eukprot:CAMPEP_0118991158 /NCGR_PEP_ID=MMETSP1173-20130426/51167_1 /TAXON_ID=1034831 /ORGANISM="Rhizochromulina marina cf, Strain CCMP1243" /LENGTH=421 /DNA_ID=CAMNT_0006942269 /DNA_START=28 /DNA_END=1293 /DNA_ORIENTATION=+